MDLKGKIVLITGAARGIGQATAVELAKAGAEIIGVDLNRDDMSQTVSMVDDLGAKFHGFECDLTNRSALEKLLSDIIEQIGGFDVVINNAGVLASGPFAEDRIDTWLKMIDINLVAVINLTHAALPILRQRGGGHIVNIASISGKIGTEGLAAYAASKHGVVGFSSALRDEVAEENIGVSWICPSFVQTRLVDGVKRTALTPLLSPEDVARAIRKAIAHNIAETVLPGSLRISAVLFPALFPKFSRTFLKWTKASRGWLDARKTIGK